jgi:hypothetical protein
VSRGVDIVGIWLMGGQFVDVVGWGSCVMD